MSNLSLPFPSLALKRLGRGWGAFINHSKYGLLCLLLAASPPSASAFTLGIEVADGVGGRIGNVPGNVGCTPYCVAQVPSEALLSLFALPDKGYRFQGWEGACAKTLGPLCTLRPNEDTYLAARFVKSQASQAPAKALLLLHGEGVKHTVWNEFVKHHFNDRCPSIYGGVVLGEDASGEGNQVYCYRIAFGYYKWLKHSETAKGIPAPSGTEKKPHNIPTQQLAYETQAAVLGILARHPNLSLTLVGQAQGGALAAQSFLQGKMAGHSRVVGVLALQTPKGKADGALRHTAWQPKHASVVELQATPEQAAKIGDALAELTPSWWMAR